LKMKTTALLVVALAVVASADNLVPSFSWIPESGSSEGVPHLAIHFNDGKPDDIAVLKRFNPIPRGANEREEDIDQCIFNGYLLFESDVYVTLTGGCPFEDSFEIQFRSKRLPNHMFKSVDGKVEIVPSIYQTKGLIYDKALKPPVQAPALKNPERNPNGMVLAVMINYDQSFSGRFGGDVMNVIRRVSAQAGNMYLWPSLAQPLNWQAYEGQNVPSYIDANEGDLNAMAYYNNGGVNSNVYLCSENDASGVVGLAWVGTICADPNYRTAVVEYFQNDMKTAEILAHEVGHNTGMNHDFTGSPGNPRYDSYGNSCTNIGGVMDYYQTVTQWSSCSNEDFAGTYHGCLGGK